MYIVISAVILHNKRANAPSAQSVSLAYGFEPKVAKLEIPFHCKFT